MDVHLLIVTNYLLVYSALSAIPAIFISPYIQALARCQHKRGTPRLIWPLTAFSISWVVHLEYTTNEPTTGIGGRRA